MSTITCSISEQLYNNQCYKPCDTNLYYDNLTDVCYKKYPEYETISGITNTTIPKLEGNTNLIYNTDISNTTTISSSYLTLTTQKYTTTKFIYRICYIDTYNLYCIGGGGLLFTIDSTFNNNSIKSYSISGNIDIYSICWSNNKICAVGGTSTYGYAVVGDFDDLTKNIIWRYEHINNTIKYYQYCISGPNDTFHMTGRSKTLNIIPYNIFSNNSFGINKDLVGNATSSTDASARGITINNNVIIIIGKTLSSSTGIYSPLLLKSTNNGSTWSLFSSIDGHNEGELESICWSNELNIYCLTAYNLKIGTKYYICIWTSSDSNTWTKRFIKYVSTSRSSAIITNINYYPNSKLFDKNDNLIGIINMNSVQVNNKIIFSDDGIIWNIVDSNYNINSFTYNSNIQQFYTINNLQNIFSISITNNSCPINTTINGNVCLRETIFKMKNELLYQPINIIHNITNLYVNDTINLSISGYFDLPIITYSSDNTNICTISGTILKATGYGLTNINIILSKTSNYNEKIYSIPIKIDKRITNIVSTNISNLEFGSTTTLSISGPIIFNIPKFITNDISNCSISNNVLTGINFGTCAIKGFIKPNYEYKYTDTNFNINIIKSNQPDFINHNINNLLVNNNINLSISGYFESPTITYSSDTSNCIIVGTQLRPIRTGNVNITINLSSTTNYNSKIYIISSIINKKISNIVSTSSTSVNYGSTTTLTVSGPIIFNTPKFTTTDISYCSISNNILSGINTGICNVKGYLDPNTEYNYTETNFNINVIKGIQPINIKHNITNIFINNTINLSISGYFENPIITYTSNDTSICTINDTILTGIKSGSTTINITLSETNNYNNKIYNIPITIIKKTVTIASTNVSSIKYGETTNLSISGPIIFNTPKFITNDSSICSISNNILTSINSGLCRVTGYIDTNEEYNYTETNFNINILKLNQPDTINHNIPPNLYVNEFFNLSISGFFESPGAVFSSDNKILIRREERNKIIAWNEGTSKINITLLATPNYNQKTYTIPIIIKKRDNYIVSTSVSEIKYGTTTDLTISGLIVLDKPIFTTNDTTNCLISGNKLTAIKYGVCNINALLGESNEHYATETNFTINVIRADQPENINHNIKSIPFDKTLYLSISGYYENPTITYSSDNTNIFTIDNNLLKGIIYGNGNIIINLSETTNYNNKTYSIPITINKLIQPEILNTNIINIFKNETINLSISGYFEDPNITFSSENPNICSIDGNLLKGINHGTTNVIINLTETNNYSSKIYTIPITIKKSIQTDIINTNIKDIFKSERLNLSVSGYFENPNITYSCENINLCTFNGNTLIPTGYGTSNVIINLSETNNYSTKIYKIPITIKKLTQPKIHDFDFVNFVFNPTIFKNEPTYIWLSNAAPRFEDPNFTFSCEDPNICIIDNKNYLIGINNGSTNLIVNSSETPNYYATTQKIPIIIHKKNQPSQLYTNIKDILNDETLELSISGYFESPTITYTTSNSNCSISGTILTGISDGSCNIIINLSETDNYYSFKYTIPIIVSKKITNIIATSSSNVNLDDTTILNVCGISYHLYNDQCYIPCDTNLYYDNLTDVCYKKYPDYETITGITNTTIPKQTISSTITKYVANQTPLSLTVNYNITSNLYRLNDGFQNLIYISNNNTYVGALNYYHLYILNSSLKLIKNYTFDLENMCYSPELNKLCTIYNGKINSGSYSDPNDISWTSTSHDTTYKDVCWASNLTISGITGYFITFGSYDNPSSTLTYKISSDGITWTNRSISLTLTNFNIYSYTFVVHKLVWSSEKQILCVVGVYGRSSGTCAFVLTLTNELTVLNKHEVNNKSGLASLHDICYSPELGLFCAVGDYNFGSFNDQTNFIITSTGDNTWTNKMSLKVAFILRNIVWAPKFNLGSISGWFITNQLNGTIYASSDSINWYLIKNLNTTITANYMIYNHTINKIIMGGNRAEFYYILSESDECPSGTTISGNLCLREIIPKILLTRQKQPDIINHNITNLFINDTINLSISGYFGSPSITYSTSNSNCTISGNTLKGITYGSCNIIINLSATLKYNSKTYTMPITISKRSTSIVSTTPSTVNYGSTVKLTISGPIIFNTPKFTTSDISFCSISNNVLSGINTGTCNVRAFLESNSEYNYTDTSFNVEVSTKYNIKELLKKYLNILSEEQLSRFEKEIQSILDNLNLDKILLQIFEILKIYLSQYLK